MSGLEGFAAGAALRGAAGAARHFAKTTEFDRLCDRLADRFRYLGWSEAHFRAWGEDGAFVEALGTLLQPPHKPDREALVAAITPLVGRVDADTPAQTFAEMVAAAIEMEIRFAKEGDSLVRAEFDRLEHVVRESASGSQPRDTHDVFEHLESVGDYLNKRDGYFSYPAVTHDTGGPAPPITPDAVVSFEQTSGINTSRIDAVPITDDAMRHYGPELVVRPDKGPAGETAARLLRSALEDGATVEIGEGITVEFTRMPPAFAEIIGRPITGRVRVGPAEPSPQPLRLWQARLQTTTDRGRAAVEVDLRVSDHPLPGWDIQMTGRYGGMAVTASVRRRVDHAEVLLGFEFARDHSPLGAQVAALRFLYAVSGAGRLVITDRDGSAHPQLEFSTESSEVGDDERNTLAFLEDVLVLQEWTGIEFEIPEEVSSDGVYAVARVAHMVRERGRLVRWHHWTATVRADRLQLLQGGDGRIRVAHSVSTSVLGQDVDLGNTAIEFRDYVVVSAIPSRTRDGFLDIRIEPASGESQEAYQHLFRGSIPTRLPRRLPPPGPPRKQRAARSRKKRRKRRHR